MIEDKINNKRVCIYEGEKREFIICDDDGEVNFEDIRKELPAIKNKITTLSEKFIEIDIQNKQRELQELQNKIDNLKLAKKMDNWINRKGITCKLTSGLPF